jgi:hypothetical protein
MRGNPPARAGSRFLAAESAAVHRRNKNAQPLIELGAEPTPNFGAASDRPEHDSAVTMRAQDLPTDGCEPTPSPTANRRWRRSGGRPADIAARAGGREDQHGAAADARPAGGGSASDQRAEAATRRLPEAARPDRGHAATGCAATRGPHRRRHPTAGQSPRPLGWAARYGFGCRNAGRAPARARRADLLGARHDQGQPIGTGRPGPALRR